MPHKSKSNCQQDATQGLPLSLSLLLCLSTQTVLFFLLINTCFTTFCLCGNSSREGEGLGPFLTDLSHWSSS